MECLWIFTWNAATREWVPLQSIAQCGTKRNVVECCGVVLCDCVRGHTAPAGQHAPDRHITGPYSYEYSYRTDVCCVGRTSRSTRPSCHQGPLCAAIDHRSMPVRYRYILVRFGTGTVQYQVQYPVHSYCSDTVRVRCVRFRSSALPISIDRERTVRVQVRGVLVGVHASCMPFLPAGHALGIWWWLPAYELAYE